MSTTIDQRVVEMRFDNKQFERGVTETMSSLDKLKQRLNFKGSSKGLENLSSATADARNGMKELEYSSYTAGISFKDIWLKAASVFEYQVANRIIQSAKRMVSSLTIDPIKTGFSEYETQIGAIQTILSNTKSKGTTLDDVNGALDELNTYADKTIYNFTEMTRNIGTFTAAGVDLDTSVSAIKGIANLAAISGSTSQQASTAMYQLSQAMASGTVKLMDWNSVVNAGMGGQVFQDALKETAKVHGIAIDDIIKKNGSFRESLSDGWLTTEILTETLSKFTGDLTESQLKSMGYTDEQIKGILELGKDANDAATKVKTLSQLFDTLKEAAQSGWAQTWEILVGDFEEAKEMFTQVSDVIGGIITKSAESRNALLENWKVLGGREDLIESFKNIFEAIVSIVKPISEAFRDIFPPVTAERLKEITNGLKEFTAKLKLSDNASDNLKRTFKGLFAVVSIVGDIFSALFKAVKILFGGVDELGGGLLSITATIGDFLLTIADTIKRGKIFEKVFTGIAKVIRFLIKICTSLVNVFADIFEFIGAEFLLPGFNAILGFFSEIFKGMSDIGSSAGKMSDRFNDAISAMGNALKSSPIFGVFASIWSGIKKIGSSIGKVLGNVFGQVFDIFATGNLSDMLEFINGLIAGGIGLKLIQLFKGIIDFFDKFGGLSDIGESITNVLESVSNALKAFQNALNAIALQKIATAIAILAGSILILSLIPADKLNDSMAAILILMVGMSVILSTLNKMSSGSGIKGFVARIRGMVALGKSLKSIGAGMLLLAAALAVMTPALIKLSKLDWTQLGKAAAVIAFLGGVIVGLTAATKLLRSGKSIIAVGLSMFVLAAALNMLVVPLLAFSLMSWGQLAKAGTVIVGLAGVLVGLGAATKLIKPGSLAVMGASLAILAASLNILIPPLLIFSLMSWNQIAKAGAVIGGLSAVLFGLGVAVKLIKPGPLAAMCASLTILAASLNILIPPLLIFSFMSWEQLAKAGVVIGGLTGVIVAFGLAAKFFGAGNIFAMCVSFAVLAASLNLLIIPFLVLSSMPWKGILVSLGSMIVTLGILGVAAKIFTSLHLTGAMLKLSVALLSFSASVLAFAVSVGVLGIALSLLGAGLALIGTGIVILVKGVVAAIVEIVDGIGEIVASILSIIVECAPLIADAIVEIVKMVCEIIVEVIPTVVKTILKLIDEILKQLADYIPSIVESILKLIVGIIRALAKYIPDIIVVIFEFIGAIFDGIVKALGAVDFVSIIGGIASVIGIIFMLSKLAPIAKAAMQGVMWFGIIAFELIAVLTLLGGFVSLFPDIVSYITKIGDVLEAVGLAIGRFVGGIVGGIAAGVTSALPLMAADLSLFMILIKPFVEGIKAVDESVWNGAKSLAGAMLAITGAGVVQAIATLFTGGMSFALFAAQLPLLGMAIKLFAKSVEGIDSSSVNSAVDAAKGLAEVANALPKTGGLISLITGNNSITKFSLEIVALGACLKSFSNSVSGIGNNSESINAAITTAKGLTEVANAIPNSGGIVSLLTGDNSIALFGLEIASFGFSLKSFSNSVVGLNPEGINAAIVAAKGLAEMSKSIPNEGGIVAWFAGENSVSKWAYELPTLGRGLKGFSDSITGINPESITAAANAAKSLAQMTKSIPNEGGVVAWFAGESSISKFANKLPVLGRGLKGFSDSTLGINIESMTAATNAAKSLAEMTKHIPNEGGVVAWFSGESSISKFSTDIVSLGKGIKGFSDATVGITPDTVSAAANAAKTLAEMTKAIPNEGGVVAWFAGESSISKFANELSSLGKGLKGFSTETEGLNVEGMTAAANAAKSLAEMTKSIPSEGGIKAWFTGKTSVSNFANKLPTLGEGLKGFSDSVAGITPENVTAAANAAKSLAEMTKTVPKETDKIITFGDNLEKFGTKLSKYFENTKSISSESATASTNAVNAVKEIVNIDSSKIKSVATALDDVTKSIQNLSKVPKDTLGSFADSLGDLGEKSVEAFTKAFDGLDTDLKKAAETGFNAFVKAIDGKKSSATKAGESIASACAKAVKGKASAFESAGKALAQGLADGISANSYKAEAKAKAMAEAAAEAARKALDINSPSKVFRALGYSIPEGLAMGVDKLSYMATDSVKDMTKDSINGVKNSIAHMANAINSDIDAQPTIRPVLDLTDVRSGASSISRMFGSGSSIGVMANVGAINSMMNARIQNGANDDVVSAINKLAKELGKGGDTYNINGINSNDDAVAEAIATIIRAAKIERRS